MEENIFNSIDTAPLQPSPDIKQVDVPASNLFEEVTDKTEDTSLFADVKNPNASPVENVALPTNSLLVAMAQVNSNSNPSLQLADENLELARNIIEQGQEKALRSKVVGERAMSRLTEFQKLKISNPLITPEQSKGIDDAYNNVLNWDHEEKARIALEEQAFDNIQDMAARDPVQAKVLLDNLEKGGAEQVMRDYTIKMLTLQQRAEELDAENRQSGWGRYILNSVLSLVPLNYNFQRSGIIKTDDAGIMDWLLSGEGLRKQSEKMWHMSPEEFAEFAAQDGPLMQGIRDNATSVFGVDDPGAAVQLLDALTAQSDSDREWASMWGVAEPLMIVPYGKIGSVGKTLVRSGARKEALDLMSKAGETLVREGPEAMAKKTAVNEEELRAAQSISMGDPAANSDFSVPLAMDLATREAAARKAIDELPAVLRENSRLTPDELMQAFESRVEQLSADLGRPLKDVKLVTETLATGNTVKYVEYVVGKAAGGGYATKQNALKAAESRGLIGEAFQKDSAKRTFLIHGGSDFDEIDFQKLGTGEPGNIRPLGKGLYGYLVKEGDKKQLAEAIEYAKVYANKYGKGKKTIHVFEADIKDSKVSFNGKEVDEFKGVPPTEQELRVKGLWKYADSLPSGEERTKAFEIAKAADAELTFNPDFRVEQLPGGLVEGSALDPTKLNRVDKFSVDAGAFRDESGQWFVRGRANIDEKGFTTNPYHEPTQGFLGSLFGRWTRSAARTTDSNIHGKAVQAGSAIQRQQKILGKQLDGVFKSLPSRSQEVVQQVSLVGANNAKWWTREEFDTLVQRGYGRQATEAELKAYQDIQLLNDMDWVLRNDQMYLDKAIKGTENVGFVTRNGQRFDIEGQVNYKPKVKPDKRIYNVSDNTHYTSSLNPLTDAEFTRLADEGYVLVKSDNAVKLPDGTTVDHFMMRRTDAQVSPLDRAQLAYSEGGHRLYTDKYFVKQASVGRQADTGTEFLQNPNVFATAKNIAEAKSWASKMEAARLAVKEGRATTGHELDELIFQGDNAFMTGDEFLEGIANGSIDKNNPFEAMFDREMPSAYNSPSVNISNFVNEDEVGFNGFYRTTGKLYTSSKGTILKDTKGRIADTVDPYEALSVSLKQISRQSGLYNYKTESIGRFIASFADNLDIPADAKSDYQKFINAKPKNNLSMQQKNIIESQREAIRTVLGFETPFEAGMKQTWRSLAEQVLGDGTNAARVLAHDSVTWMSQKNPIASLRGIAFDMKLGLWNVGQLPIQMATMFSALALSPRAGLKGFATLPLHAYLLKGGSENVLDVLTKRGLGKAAGFSSDEEFKVYARSVHQSGFMDMDGSHVMIGDNGSASVYGSFGDKAERVKENGRMFFYAAETYNRLVAYRIAWDEVTSAGLKPGMDGFNSKVLQIADDYSFNMTKESAASWQKGLMSIPTQFWAYNLRMMDHMIGGRFTMAQKGRLIGMNLTLGGVSGIPVAPALYTMLTDHFGVEPGTPDFAPENLLSTLDRGLLDRLAFEINGANVRIGEKAGTGEFFTNTVKDLFGQGEYGPKPWAEVMGGASYSILKSAGTTGLGLLKYTVAESGGDMGMDGLAGDEFLKLASEVSTFNNITKAMLAAQYGIYRSKSGTDYPDIPKTDAFYIALGYRPQEIATLGHMMRYNEKKDEAIKDAANQLKKWRQQAFNNPDDMEPNMKKANALIRLLPEDVRREAIKRANGGEDSTSLFEHVAEKYHKEKLEQESLERMEQE